MRSGYRVLVCGHTGRGDYGHHLDTVWTKRDDSQIVGIVDPNEAGRAKAAARLGVDATYASIEEAIDRERPDIMAICPRWIDQHHAWAMPAAERGIHLFMEKPFCRSLQEADRIIAACEASGSKLALAHQTRYSPVTSQVRSLLEAGAIGELLEIRARGKEDHRGGCEDLWVLGSHLLNLIHHLGGEAVATTAYISSGAEAVGPDDVIGGNEGLGPMAGDRVQAMFTLSNGATAFFGSCRQAAGRRFGLQIFGSRGVIELLTGFLPEASILQDPAWSPVRSKATWVPITSQGMGQAETIRDQDGLAGNQAVIDDLICAIREDRHPECSMYEGRMTIEMISSVFASHRSGRRETLPLAQRSHPWSDWN